MPIYTRCIQPQSTNPKLFTNRKDEYDHIKAILSSIIRARGEAERRLLIHGDRGTGKSILLRKVLYDLKQETPFIPVIVDGKDSKNAEELLRDICEHLASELRVEYEGDEKVIREISYLDEMSRVNTVTTGWAKSRAEEIEATTGAEIGILGFLKLKMGIGSKNTRTKGGARNVEIEIDSRFLRQLLSQVIERVSSKRAKEVVIAIDGLDQIHDKAQIDEFVREIFKYKKSLIIVVLRSEAITFESHRSFCDTIVIKDLSGDALQAILDKRIENCPDKAILGEKLSSIAKTLRTITANPFSFLSWVHFLCNNTELNPETVLDDLKGFVSTSYGVDPEKTSVISKFFISAENPFLTRDKIVDQSGISDGDYETMTENGILVPDDLYEPQKYRLSPDLAFFELGK